MRHLLNDAVKHNTLFLFFLVLRRCINCEYPRVSNSKYNCQGSEAVVALMHALSVNSSDDAEEILVPYTHRMSMDAVSFGRLGSKSTLS